MTKKLSFIGLSILLLLSLALAGCSQSTEAPKDEGQSTESTSVGDTVNYEIIGIDPGAGLMKLTNKVIEDYELKDWKLVEGSSAAMTAALKKAYEKEEPIIVTGWTPHWMFSAFDLKYLDDPKGVYGAAENINTIVRKGLKEDDPTAHKILDNFHWTPDDMGAVMVMIQDGLDPAEAAAKWVEENNDKVKVWTDGLEKVDGNKIRLAYVAWDSEIASTNVVAKVLEDMGYEVELQQVEAAMMFAGIASDSSDGMVAAWLPTTHADYYEEYQDKFEDLGTNLEGTKLGLVVPAYMDIASIEDLK